MVNIKVYLIGGLATDSRIFRNILLPEGFQKECLDFIVPEQKESLPDYAIRLAAKINKSQPFVLIGLSFGGMLAVEIARKYKPIACILIASISSSQQLPGIYRVFQKISFHKWLPVRLLCFAGSGIRLISYGSFPEKKLMVELIQKTDPWLLRWSFEAILTWKSGNAPGRIYHIHGRKDRIVPIRFVEPTHILEDGKHMLVIRHTQALNDILSQILTAIAKAPLSFPLPFSSTDHQPLRAF